MITISDCFFIGSSIAGVTRRGGRDVTVAGGQREASTQPVIIYLYMGEAGLRVQTGFVGEYKQYGTRYNYRIVAGLSSQTALEEYCDYMCNSECIDSTAVLQVD